MSDSTVKLGGTHRPLTTCRGCRGRMIDHGDVFDRCWTCIVGERREGESLRDYRERGIRACAKEAERLRTRSNVRELRHRAVQGEIRHERRGLARGVETVRAGRYL